MDSSSINRSRPMFGEGNQIQKPAPGVQAVQTAQVLTPVEGTAAAQETQIAAPTENATQLLAAVKDDTEFNPDVVDFPGEAQQEGNETQAIVYQTKITGELPNLPGAKDFNPDILDFPVGISDGDPQAPTIQKPFYSNTSPAKPDFSKHLLPTVKMAPQQRPETLQKLATDIAKEGKITLKHAQPLGKLSDADRDLVLNQLKQIMEPAAFQKLASQIKQINPDDVQVRPEEWEKLHSLKMPLASTDTGNVPLSGPMRLTADVVTDLTHNLSVPLSPVAEKSMAGKGGISNNASAMAGASQTPPSAQALEEEKKKREAAKPVKSAEPKNKTTKSDPNKNAPNAVQDKDVKKAKAEKVEQVGQRLQKIDTELKNNPNMPPADREKLAALRDEMKAIRNKAISENRDLNEDEEKIVNKILSSVRSVLENVKKAKPAPAKAPSEKDPASSKGVHDNPPSTKPPTEPPAKPITPPKASGTDKPDAPTGGKPTDPPKGKNEHKAVPGSINFLIEMQQKRIEQLKSVGASAEDIRVLENDLNTLQERVKKDPNIGNTPLRDMSGDKLELIQIESRSIKIVERYPTGKPTEPAKPVEDKKPTPQPASPEMILLLADKQVQMTQDWFTHHQIDGRKYIAQMKDKQKELQQLQAKITQEKREPTEAERNKASEILREMHILHLEVMGKLKNTDPAADPGSWKNALDQLDRLIILSTYGPKAIDQKVEEANHTLTAFRKDMTRILDSAKKENRKLNESELQQLKRHLTEALPLGGKLEQLRDAAENSALFREATVVMATIARDLGPEVVEMIAKETKNPFAKAAAAALKGGIEFINTSYQGSINSDSIVGDWQNMDQAAKRALLTGANSLFDTFIGSKLEDAAESKKAKLVLGFLMAAKGSAVDVAKGAVSGEVQDLQDGLLKFAEGTAMGFVGELVAGKVNDEAAALLRKAGIDEATIKKLSQGASAQDREAFKKLIPEITKKVTGYFQGEALKGAYGHLKEDVKTRGVEAVLKDLTGQMTAMGMQPDPGKLRAMLTGL